MIAAARTSPQAYQPQAYSRDYLLSSGGYEVYLSSGGAELIPRHRAMLALARLQPGEHVLDMSCGRGELTYQCALVGCHVTAADFSPDAIALTRETVERLPADVRARVSIVRQEASTVALVGPYDVVLLADVVEHLTAEQLAQFFRRLREHLGSGARVVIHTDNGFYHHLLFPMSRTLSLPFTVARHLLRLAWGHREPSWAAWRRKAFTVLPPSDAEELHVTVFTPTRLRRFLRQWLPGAEVSTRVEGRGQNLLSLLMNRWWGGDLYAVARIHGA